MAKEKGSYLRFGWIVECYQYLDIYHCNMSEIYYHFFIILIHVLNYFSSFLLQVNSDLVKSQQKISKREARSAACAE